MKYIFILFFCTFSIFSFAQQKDSSFKKQKHAPIVLLDNVKLDSVNFKNINRDNISSVAVFKGSNAISLFGQEAEYGILFITSKDAVKKYWNFLKSKSDDYAEDFPTPFSDSTAQYIINDSLVKYPAITLQQLNDSNFQYIRVIGKAELIRNYNVNNKLFGVKVKATNVTMLPFKK